MPKEQKKKVGTPACFAGEIFKFEPRKNVMIDTNLDSNLTTFLP